MSKETEDNWGFMWPGDDDHFYYEDGTKEKLAPRHNTLTFGKYKGQHLGEIDDVGYLRWLLKTAEEKDDWFLSTTVTMRLNELQ